MQTIVILFVVDEILEELGCANVAEDGGEHPGVGGRGIGRLACGAVRNSGELKRHDNAGAPEDLTVQEVKMYKGTKME